MIAPCFHEYQNILLKSTAICDIGTASFKYDMRRLSEILSLPKAWYRRTLARRLFLGDESVNPNRGDGKYAYNIVCSIFLMFYLLHVTLSLEIVHSE